MDIGSGPGVFLKMAMDDGWDVEGVEPRLEAARFCNENFGIKVHTGDFEDYDFRFERYDVITLWDVLEHVASHDRFLNRAIDLLAPGGVLIIAIPNASGWPARLFKGHWRYTMESHINYFKMPYLEKYLSKQNVDIEKAYHTFKIHSLVQGVCSFLPFEVNMKNVFAIGNLERGTNAGPKPVDSKPKKIGNLGKFLNDLRKLAFKINMWALPFGIGDMVDLYCRKRW